MPAIKELIHVLFFILHNKIRSRNYIFFRRYDAIHCVEKARPISDNIHVSKFLVIEKVSSTYLLNVAKLILQLVALEGKGRVQNA